ncbi:MAG: hypothetical protein CMN45_01265 [SAR116 cluster bacterium]|nr:hypothetical protein [SAR116 cluster bacterium]|tara:strand:- start:903 stop:1127 length:225 start_codon:yes stop_codon:yes gene_type:complete
MARRRKERSLGEMISTVCFYVVGAYFVFEGASLRDAGGEPFRYIGMWLAGLACLLGGARFLIADLVAQIKAIRR